MFDRLKKLLDGLKKSLESKDDRELNEAKNSFDELMKKVDDDELALEKLERHVQQEFEEIEGDIKEIREEVDEVVQDKTA